MQDKTMCVCVHGHVVLFLWPTRLLFPRDFPDKNTGVGSPGDLPNPWIEPESPVVPALAGRFFTTEPPGKPQKRP